MVRSFRPQGTPNSIVANTNKPPQGLLLGGVVPPPVGDFWINDASEVFIDDQGEQFEFEV